METINVENQKMELPFDENEQANVILGTDTFPLRAIRFHSQPTISQGSMSRRWKWETVCDALHLPVEVIVPKAGDLLPNLSQDNSTGCHIARQMCQELVALCMYAEYSMCDAITEVSLILICKFQIL